MHILKHPIAVFVVTVLAVIGIGVGVMAASTNSTVYGPSWGRFTAAFDGSVRVVRPSEIRFVSQNLTESVSVLRAIGPSGVKCAGGFWTGYAPVMPSGHPQVSCVNDVHVWNYPLRCQQQACTDAKVVVAQQVAYFVVASSSNTEDAENFLGSFQPLG